MREMTGLQDASTQAEVSETTKEREKFQKRLKIWCPAMVPLHTNNSMFIQARSVWRSLQLEETPRHAYAEVRQQKPSRIAA